MWFISILTDPIKVGYQVIKKIAGYKHLDAGVTSNGN